MFRWAQLLLLLAAADRAHPEGTSMERLVHYDFFSGNPYLIVGPDDAERDDLALAGFNSRALSYASSGHRFATRREKIEFDLSALVARGLVEVRIVSGRILYRSTNLGNTLRASFTAMYADDYRKSADMIVRRLKSLSDTALADRARQWLQASDTFADVQLLQEASE